VSEPVFRAESTPAPAAAQPITAAPPAPIVNVEKALQESGLVMIQTDPNKVKPAEPVAAPRYVPPQPRPRRAPPPDTGPLQIVETRKDAQP
jgi:ribonuclease E